MILRAAQIGPGLVAGLAANLAPDVVGGGAREAPCVPVLIVAGPGYVSLPRQRLAVIGLASGAVIFTACLLLLLWW